MDLNKEGRNPMAPPEKPPARAGGSVLARRNEIRKVAKEMDADLANLRAALALLKAMPPGQVGAWDVAHQFGQKLGTAHAGMIAALDAYCATYEATKIKLEQTAANLDQAELLSTAAVQTTGSDDRPPAHVKPW
ncbi:hypothetical protein [Actinomadura rayongensis]|uniref:Uncharacterized protein n=1 Tax=Actinomadura rayongensis TaxID=1429076 RepID=A0A6I4W7U5_9ACTN|nr:hypothetical protein [Actinomadura rayongensis]MXQ64325.1 hypothetical protein [Actinomadura rayongensis]